MMPAQPGATINYDKPPSMVNQFKQIVADDIFINNPLSPDNGEEVKDNAS